MLLNRHRRLRYCYSLLYACKCLDFKYLRKKRNIRKKTEKAKQGKKEKKSNKGAGVLTFIKLICYNVVITYLL